MSRANEIHTRVMNHLKAFREIIFFTLQVMADVILSDEQVIKRVVFASYILLILIDNM